MTLKMDPEARAAAAERRAAKFAKTREQRALERRAARTPEQQAEIDARMEAVRQKQREKRAQRAAELEERKRYAGQAGLELATRGLKLSDPWPIDPAVEAEYRTAHLKLHKVDPLDFLDVLNEGKILVTSKTQLGLMPFTPAVMHTPQRMILERIKRNLMMRRKSLFAIFKPRQRAGISTFQMSVNMAHWACRHAYRIKVAAVQQETLDDLWEMYRLATDGLMGNLVAEVGDLDEELENERDGRKTRGGLKANSRYIMHPKLRSRVMIQNALKNLGRGGGWNIGHFSEPEYYPDFWKAYKAVMPGMNDHWTTIAAFESTMEAGIDTAYKDFVIAALENKAFGDRWAQHWEAIFIPWFASENAAVPMSAEEKKAFGAELDTSEKLLQETHNLSLEQLLWRRRTLTEQFAGNVALFDEAYPPTADHALRTSFQGAWLHEDANSFYRQQCRQPNARYIVDITAAVRMTPLEDPRDWDLMPHMELFAPPEAGGDYAIIADAGSNKGRGTGGENFALVGDIRTGKIMAIWRSRQSTHQFAYAVAQMQAYFNNAWIIAENNKDGGLIELLTIRLQCSQVYRMERFGRPNWHEDQDVYGFTMNEATRGMAMDRLRLCWNEQRLLVPSQILYDQVQLTAKRRGQSVSGSEKMKNPDDGAVCLAIFCLVRDWSGKWPVRTLDDARTAFMEQKIVLASDLRGFENVETSEMYESIADSQRVRDALTALRGG